MIFIKVNTPNTTGIKTISSKLKEISDLLDQLNKEQNLYKVSIFKYRFLKI